MAPTLETLEGTVVDVTPPDPDAVDREFSKAMADAGPDAQAPPRRQPGAAPAPAPRRRGRPTNAERARTTAAAAPAAAAGLDDEQRTTGVKSWAQILAGGVLLVGKATKKDAYKADAVTIASAADDAAKACVDLAKTDPKFAAALDRVCAVGPYGALITVGVGIATQVVRNHRPALKLAGTVDPAELLKAQDEAEAEAAAEKTAA